MCRPAEAPGRASTAQHCSKCHTEPDLAIRVAQLPSCPRRLEELRANRHRVLMDLVFLQPQLRGSHQPVPRDQVGQPNVPRLCPAGRPSELPWEIPRAVNQDQCGEDQGFALPGGTSGPDLLLEPFMGARTSEPPSNLLVFSPPNR